MFAVDSSIIIIFMILWCQMHTGTLVLCHLCLYGAVCSLVVKLTVEDNMRGSRPVRVGEKFETAVGEVIPTVHFNLLYLIMPLVVLVVGGDDGVQEHPGLEELEAPRADELDRQHVVVPHYTARPVDQASQDMTSLHWHGAADFFVFIVLIVAIIMTVTHEQVIDTFLSS